MCYRLLDFARFLAALRLVVGFFDFEDLRALVAFGALFAVFGLAVGGGVKVRIARQNVRASAAAMLRSRKAWISARSASG